MVKVVYVLVSSEKDYFYEQMIMSAYSLRYQTQDVHIVLLVDQDTNNYLTNKQSSVNSYVDEIVVHELSEKYSMKERSRILKTKMRSLISGDFLYIDCDTVISKSLDGITQCENTSAVLDSHSLINDDMVEFLGVVERAKSIGYSTGYANKHYNGGVMWCKDDEETHKFFSLWHELWCETNSKGFAIDQLSLNEANNRMNGFIQDLPGEWNCQIKYGLPYLANAKILHYFASNINSSIQKLRFSCKFTDNDLWRNIRNEGLTTDVKEMLHNPLQAFNSAVIIEVGTPNYAILNSNMASLLRAIYRKMPRFYKGLDRFLGFFNRRK